MGSSTYGASRGAARSLGVPTNANRLNRANPQTRGAVGAREQQDMLNQSIGGGANAPMRTPASWSTELPGNTGIPAPKGGPLKFETYQGRAPRTLDTGKRWDEINKRWF